MWKNGLDHEERCTNVEVEDFIEVFGSDVPNKFVCNHGGIVDQNVNVRSEGFECGVYDLFGSLDCLQITLKSYCRAVGFGFDPCDEFVYRFF